MNLKRAVFLDRDGVLNPDTGNPHKLEDSRLFDDVVPALAELQAQGFKLIVVSNQGGIGRGLFQREDADRFNDNLARLLCAGGVEISSPDFFYCPHRQEDNCLCRKPRPGLILEAAQVHGVRLDGSVIVGDQPSDIGAGRAAGLYTVFLDRLGTAGQEDADLVISSLLELPKHLERSHRQADQPARITAH